MKAYRIVFGLALAAGVSSVPAVSFGQSTPRQESPMVAARKAETEAFNALTLAKKDLDRARQKVIAAFKTTQPEYVKAEQDLTKAKAAMETAKAAAQTKTRSLPEYRAAMAAKTKAQEKLTALRDEKGLAADKERNALLEESTRHAAVLNRLDQASLTNDAGYADAKAKVAELTKSLESFTTQIDEACKADPEYMTAEQNVLTATESHNQAKLATTEAQRSMAEAAKAARESRASEAKSRSKSN